MGFLMGKNAYRDDARPLVYGSFKSQWIVNVQAVHIQNMLTVVG